MLLASVNLPPVINQRRNLMGNSKEQTDSEPHARPSGYHLPRTREPTQGHGALVSITGVTKLAMAAKGDGD